MFKHPVKLSETQRTIIRLARKIAELEEEVKQLKKRKGSTRFTPPTIDEVAAWIRHKGYCIDAETFWHYHEARGWVLSNGRQMRSWKSALVTFQKNTQYQPATLQATDDLAKRRARREEQRRQFAQDNANAIRPRIKKA